MSHQSLPVVVIGAGPVGLAAASHLLARNLTPRVFEAGPSAGSGITRWGHVRLFSPWKFNVDKAAVAILERHGWLMPEGDIYPTGHDLVNHYLEPLAGTSELAPCITFNSRVVAVARQDHDLMKDAGRDGAPYLVRVTGPQGEQDVLAQAVIDASGTIDTPGALGASGLPAIGEAGISDRIFYGIPDIVGAHRTRYEGRRVLVVGSGHSALNALLDLAQLAADDANTQIVWAIRRPSLGQILGGARNDQLEERGKLGSSVRMLLDAGRLELVTGFRLDRLTQTTDGIVASAGARRLEAVDQIIAATGFRPDWSILSEVRLDLDAALQSPKALAPLIDPNVHSCGTVRPHGAEELKQPDANVFAIGMKSYGRAPTFLMLTGYEQARSVVSAIAGDWDAARRVELVLPETGVCSLDSSPDAAVGCCDSGQIAAVPVTVGAHGLADQARLGPRCCS
jgi:thioredoxin reductase